ncbi:MAG: 6-carboxytetrahydropterin synthase QueD [Candidatus Omnitrophota bacterium]
MFEIRVASNFCAAHYLERYKGKCESLHGHNWKVVASVCANRLDYRGLVIDFKDLKSLLNETISSLDHKLLNDMPFFKKNNTTSEVIAQHIYRELNKKLKEFTAINKTMRLRLWEVSVWEQENSCAVYRPGKKR